MVKKQRPANVMKLWPAVASLSQQGTGRERELLAGRGEPHDRSRGAGVARFVDGDVVLDGRTHGRLVGLECDVFRMSLD